MGQSVTSFKPGHSGNPKGRVKGNKNKRTLRVEELCREKDFDPILFLIDVALDEKEDMNNRLRAACEINGCLYPKRKSVELDTHGDLEIRIINYGKNDSNDST